MKSTQEALQGIVNYEKISTMNVLDVPKIKKDEIPNFIQCQNFGKAQQKIKQKMERYNSKTSSLSNEIDNQKEIIKKANRETSYCNTSDAQAVARHNDWVERGRKAVDKQNDLIDKYNDALEEAKEKLQELTEDSLAAIDEDIVMVLDKCTKISSKFAGSQNSQDLMAAIETSFIEMKIHNFFEDFIDDNTARRDAKERMAEVNKIFAELCANKDVRQHLADLFRRNIYLIEKNDDIYGQINQIINAVDKMEMDESIQELKNIFNENLKTNFDYQNIIDPSELENLIVKINKTIDSIKSNISRVNEHAESSKSLSEKSAEAHEDIAALLESMKDELKNMGNDLILPGFFAIEMLNESVIDDFYSRDLRSPVNEFRELLAKELGEEKLDRLIMSDGDKYSIEKGESAINEADLLRLKNERGKIKEHINKMNKLIESLINDIKAIEGVPKEKAEALKSEYSLKSILSCIPFIGIIFSFILFRKIKIFESAFRSSNKIYKDLGKTLFDKNKSRVIVNLIVGLVVSIGGLVALLAVGNNLAIVLQYGLPGALLIIYLLTTLFILLIGKRIGSYLGITNTTEKKAV